MSTHIMRHLKMFNESTPHSLMLKNKCIEIQNACLHCTYCDITFMNNNALVTLAITYAADSCGY